MRRKIAMLCCAWPRRINWVKVVWHYLGRVRLRAKRTANEGPLGMYPLANRLCVRGGYCFGFSGEPPPQAGQFVRHHLHPLISFSAGGRFVFRSLLCRLPRRRLIFSPGDSDLEFGNHIPGIHIVQRQLH